MLVKIEGRKLKKERERERFSVSFIAAGIVALLLNAFVQCRAKHCQKKFNQTRL